MSIRARTLALEKKLNIDRGLERDIEIAERPDATPEEIERGFLAEVSIYDLEALIEESMKLEPDKARR